MIEWIIGAAVIGLLGKGKGKKRIRRATVGSLLLNIPPNIDSSSNHSEWRAEWEHTVDFSRWIPKHIASDIPKHYPPRENGSNTAIPLSKHFLYEKAIRSEFDAHNEKFLNSQKKKLCEFFSTVESHPLTDEQIASCVCMDDAIQIVAAAGSGKTSTIIARIGYVLQEGLAKPEEILVLAFNSSVKEELQARIQKQLGRIENIELVKVKTFNAFGLEVIGKSVGRKPRLADWVEPGRDAQSASEIVEYLRQRDPKFRNQWDTFRAIFGRDIGNWGSSKQPRSDTVGNGNILTADGKYVKSHEERIICNFLFYHGVAYEYERPYEYDTVAEDRSQYHPDFYYPLTGLYHEHFAINADGNAPPHFTGDYMAGVHWKRSLHAEKETQLFETTSHEIRNCDGINKLKLELEKRGEVLDFNIDRDSQGQKLIPTAQLIATIRSFQQHVKSNGLSNSDLRNTIRNFKHGHHERLKQFVSLYERISDEWQRRLRLEESVDFDDMLLQAIEHIEGGNYQSPFKMVLTDEFQDVSQSKLRLLKALKKNAGKTSSICVVGDDWQGINRFAGSDISIMVGFDQSFPNSTQLTLGTTFRCPQLLCAASSQFIQKNPNQIQKTVKTTNGYKNNPLQAFAAEDEHKALEHLEKTLRDMHQYSRAGKLDIQDGRRISVMMIGRYRKDEPREQLKNWRSQMGDELDIYFYSMWP